LIAKEPFKGRRANTPLKARYVFADVPEIASRKKPARPLRPKPYDVAPDTLQNAKLPGRTDSVLTAVAQSMMRRRRFEVDAGVQPAQSPLFGQDDAKT
jgi:hypothetical protein